MMVFSFPTEREPCWNRCVSEEIPLGDVTWIFLIRAIGGLALTLYLYHPRWRFAIGLLSSFGKIGLWITADWDIASLGRLLARWFTLCSSLGCELDDEDDNGDDTNDNDDDDNSIGDGNSVNDELDSSFDDSLDSCNILAPGKLLLFIIILFFIFLLYLMFFKLIEYYAKK